ncbi:TIGR04255 family protein [Flavobacterium sp. LaA7.5]|nr:TIGR04255 family protein [Flavobacterium salilacus subsp. altitudinum]
MLKHLIPISENHSIGKVVATFYLAQEILKPDVYYNELKDKEKFKKYQKKSLTSSQKITVGNSIKDISIDHDKESGLIFEKFNDDGLLKNIISIQNEVEQNRATISYETRNYSTWDDFFRNLTDDILTIYETKDFYTKAIRLNYVDEFAWESSEKIEVDSIFNVNSELMNKKFLHSENGTILMLSQNRALNIEERTEISFNNRIKKILINHQYVCIFEQILSSKDMIKNGLAKHEFNQAHDSNKDMLNDLLTEDVRRLIGLI